MRLLRSSKPGEFNFSRNFVGNDIIPPYAILSHTWGADSTEVPFEDLTNGTGKDKPGYKKIRFCGEQARQDDLQYFWVNTCCINKANYTNSRRLSTPCFAGAATRLDATSIYQIFLALPLTPTRSLTRGRGNEISGKADGPNGVGRFKSFLPLVRSNSSPKNASDLVIKD